MKNKKIKRFLTILGLILLITTLIAPSIYSLWAYSQGKTMLMAGHPIKLRLSEWLYFSYVYLFEIIKNVFTVFIVIGVMWFTINFIKYDIEKEKFENGTIQQNKNKTKN